MQSFSHEDGFPKIDAFQKKVFNFYSGFLMQHSLVVSPGRYVQSTGIEKKKNNLLWSLYTVAG